MSKIKVMDEILANKIAAGEVIERCVSIVKELVENSIDAKSSMIKIELIDSGVTMIKVVDDGIGMDYEDAHLAFLRHATSKLLSDDDLFALSKLSETYSNTSGFTSDPLYQEIKERAVNKGLDLVSNLTINTVQSAPSGPTFNFDF